MRLCVDIALRLALLTFASCGTPAHCVRADLALWKSNDKDTSTPYRATVRCHNPNGHTDVELIRSKTKIELLKGEK